MTAGHADRPAAIARCCWSVLLVPSAAQASRSKLAANGHIGPFTTPHPTVGVMKPISAFPLSLGRRHTSTTQMRGDDDFLESLDADLKAWCC